MARTADIDDEAIKAEVARQWDATGRVPRPFHVQVALLEATGARPNMERVKRTIAAVQEERKTEADRRDEAVPIPGELVQAAAALQDQFGEAVDRLLVRAVQAAEAAAQERVAEADRRHAAALQAEKDEYAKLEQASAAQDEEITKLGADKDALEERLRALQEENASLARRLQAAEVERDTHRATAERAQEEASRFSARLGEATARANDAETARDEAAADLQAERARHAETEKARAVAEARLEEVREAHGKLERKFQALVHDNRRIPEFQAQAEAAKLSVSQAVEDMKALREEARREHDARLAAEARADLAEKALAEVRVQSANGTASEQAVTADAGKPGKGRGARPKGGNGVG